MPILSASVFDNTGKSYDVSKILKANFTFDANAYHNYSPVFLPITYVLSYALQFASLTALLTHTICWHGHDILAQTKESFWNKSSDLSSSYQDEAARSTDALLTDHDPPPGGAQSLKSQSSSPNRPSVAKHDVHNRLMERYEDVPISWYLLTGLSMLIIGMLVVE